MLGSGSSTHSNPSTIQSMVSVFRHISNVNHPLILLRQLATLLNTTLGPTVGFLSHLPEEDNEIHFTIAFIKF